MRPLVVVLLDEGIGAGDASFLEKANERLDQFIKKAGILVLASHSIDLVRRLCNRAVVMEHGRLVWAGGIEEGLTHYHERQIAATSAAAAAPVPA